MILVVLYIYINCTVDKTNGTETSNIHCDYITCCIIIITLTIIFWYYLLAHVANLSKHTHLERYVTVLLELGFFYQMRTLTTDLCLLLLKLKMHVNISNLGFIWKYKRLFTRKSQNDADINQINLKTPTPGFQT